MNAYKGKYKDGLYHGLGKLTLENVFTYKGKFKEGFYHGYGELTNENGAVYKGEFKQGLKHGNGEYTDENGSFYKGIYKNGLKDGNGELTYKNGAYYKGRFTKGVADGKGELTYENGAFYKGGFKQSLKHGMGEYTDEYGTVYKGMYKNGLPDGEGELTYHNKYVYKGKFNQGLKHGYGKFTLANGDFFEGEFRKDKAHHPNLNTKKKNQTILHICHKANFNISSFHSLQERYKKVMSLDKTSTMNADFLKELITYPTKGDTKKKKIKALIDEHTYITGEFPNKNFILKTLLKTLEEIKEYNKEEVENPVKRIDIVLNVCFASKVVRENKEFQKVLKSFIKEDIEVHVSASDVNSETSNILINNKNLLPVSKTDGYYIIYEYCFKEKGDFDFIEPIKIKKYETIPNFFEDDYLRKEKAISNELSYAYTVAGNYSNKRKKRQETNEPYRHSKKRRKSSLVK